MDQLKHFFDEALVARLADTLLCAYPPLDRASFIEAATRGLSALELTERAHLIKVALRDHLPGDYAEAVAVLMRSLGAPLDSTELTGLAPFFYLPHVYFVADYGLEHFEDSMAAQHALTQRFSAEFSIRAYLLRHPEATLARLREWTRDPSPHVRRLVSEGTRPRLPWAMRLRPFQQDPTPTLELLELLKDDPELYVRRSVANHLGDIGKDHSDRAVEVCRRWLAESPSPERRWLVSHALRWLIKQGHPGALLVMGIGERPRVAVHLSRIHPTHPTIGGAIDVELVVRSTAETTQRLGVDLVIHYVKAGGETSPRVFKLEAIELGPGQRHPLRKKISLRQMSTRTHYPGEHLVAARINGVDHPLGSFQLRP